ncbi:carboxypeptidase regulatory-like domain-containing protein [Acidipila sp. EB88]|nr:carboxypeptidase regulatory-like domain-containing protein [Acidipila sp. EB88]
MSNGFPVPGATVTATQGTATASTVTDAGGFYVLDNVKEGIWAITVQMLLFASSTQQVSVGSNATPLKWELKPLALADATARAAAAAHAATPRTAGGAVTAQGTPAVAPSPAAKQGLLLNGSVNNAATSQYSLARAFGNTRNSSRNLYTGLLHFDLGNSALDARPYSLTGQEAPKPGYSQVTGIISVGGPLQIPRLLRRGPEFNVEYRWRRDSQSAIDTGLVPSLSQLQDAATSAVPAAAALLALYPAPNVVGNTAYNYQRAVLNGTHLDSLLLHVNGNKGPDSFAGRMEFDSTRADTTNLFGFRDATATLDLATDLGWHRRWANNRFSNVTYAFSRARTEVMPFFENRVNVAGDAGLAGVNQDPANWGPPTLNFSSGIASLTDAQSARNRTETNALGASYELYRGRHNIKLGGDLRRQEFNYFTQSNPRGSFTFTGAALGSDFADFLAGVPDSAQISYGNPDKYLRQTVADVYANDDWRLEPDLTLNLGVRWEYEAPATELKHRLANIDAADDFAVIATVTAQTPEGPLTGARYPQSLVRPDRRIVEPIVGVAWRPLAGSSLLIRAGYGLRADTSIYGPIALALAEQAPFATTIAADNASCPQRLASGPTACTTNAANTFGIDPNYRRGAVQQWQVSAQKDLPAALQFDAWYAGTQGLNGMQQFLPNTYPVGANNPCPTCVTGFVYRTSTGSSDREEGRVQLRRRLRSGLSATATYTFSKSIDDDSVLGGGGPLTPSSSAGAISAAAASTATTAQDWRNLRAERSRSSFDQRHLLNATFAYTTGMGIGGGTLLNGWRGRLYKEWTVTGTIAAGSGLPLTPVYEAVVPGTGFSGSIRPDRTAAAVHAISGGYFLNPAAYAAPAPGQWGDAGRNSITGPSTFSFNSSFARTFRLPSHLNFDFRVDATNVLNHVNYSTYLTTLNPSSVSPTFGLPGGTNPMRSLQLNATLRF